MSAFDDISAQAAAVWFDSDILAEAATLNGGAVTVCVLEQGREEDDNSIFDFLAVALQLSDYATCTYRTDTLVYGSVTWRYPQIRQVDGVSNTVRWISNQKPRMGG
jgi:hypothetical protein